MTDFYPTRMKEIFDIPKRKRKNGRKASLLADDFR
jgi:hypothetical protein